MALASWNAVPGDSTYSWKIALENALLFVLSPSEKLQTSTHVKLTERRFGELQTILSRNDEEVTEGFSNFSEQMRLTTSNISEIDNNESKIALTQQYIESLNDIVQELEEEQTVRNLNRNTTTTSTTTTTTNTGNSNSGNSTYYPTPSNNSNPSTGIPTQTVTPVPAPTENPPTDEEVDEEIEDIKDEIEDIIEDLEELEEEAMNAPSSANSEKKSNKMDSSSKKSDKKEKDSDLNSSPNNDKEEDKEKFSGTNPEEENRHSSNKDEDTSKNNYMH